METVTYPVVDVYIAGHCAISAYAYEVVEMIRRDYPQVDVHLIDIHHAEQVPANVFATPTYLLNGGVWSLGNPSVEKIRDAFESVQNE